MDPPWRLVRGGTAPHILYQSQGPVTFGLHTLSFRDRTLLSQCFRVIGQGLRFVRLHHVKGTPQTLTSLIQQLTTTQTLAIKYYTESGYMSPEEPVGETNGRFQGTLRLLSIEFSGLAATDSIARLPLEYKEVTLISSLCFVEPYNRLFLACAPTLERLRIIDTRKPRSHWAIPIGVPTPRPGGCSRNRRFLGIDRS